MFFLSGCQKQSQQIKNSKNVSICSDTWQRFLVLQARMIDIPIPVEAVPISEGYEGEGPTVAQIVQYKVPSSKQAIFDFYTYEMERMGWLCSLNLDEVEGLLVFSKPERLCVISIRPDSQGVTVIISTGARYKE